jgi:methionyl aminopeptidase
MSDDSSIQESLPAAAPDADQAELRAKALDYFRQAGKIAASIKKDAAGLVNPGESAFDIAETVEKMTRDGGAVPGFPCNISINDIAAHYTPETKDSLLIGEKDLVKVDFGVSINGCVADTAFSIDLSGEQGSLLEASSAALQDAVSSIRPGKTNGFIGGVIEKQIRSRGFKPIENLNSHMIEPFRLHAGVDVPSIATADEYVFEEGDVFAIEPFATTGLGHVVDQPQVEIFAVVGEGRLRMKSSRELLHNLVTRYFTLPFAERWLVNDFHSRLTLSAALKELINAGCLYPYPVLREAGHGLVAQFENTLIVTHDGCEVISGVITP